MLELRNRARYGISMHARSFTGKDRDGQKQDSEIDVEVGFIWVGVVRQARDDEPNALVGNKDAQSRSSHR